MDLVVVHCSRSAVEVVLLAVGAVHVVVAVGGVGVDAVAELNTEAWRKTNKEWERDVAPW